ncbi:MULTISPECIES: ACP S-malonyltransferase [unclassified Burkholderia]|uniref:ACP S-malonyltransferase n=1 Tax=unclassified Burkholderia TaxID=2613784 RepID=UPI00158D9E79|nr:MULTISPECIES: ACP S-malonyltransferase [unclassified Burkholderia]
MSRAWLFPGQGTQRRGMGAQVFDLFPGLVAKADRILGYSIRELCVEDPDERLATTEYCQPALYVVNALMFLERRRREPWPAFLAGHSLGEFSALFAAGCFDFETGLRIVQCRARCMAPAGNGSMLAVIGLDLEQLLGVIDELDLTGLDVANYNLPTQTVLAGPDASIATLDAVLVERELARTVHLHVGGAFHSRYAEQAAARFRDMLREFELADPKWPTVSSATGQVYRPGTVREVLETQIVRPVRWVDAMQFLHDRGVTDAVQIGPGRVLDGLWERFEPGAGALPGHPGKLAIQ